MNQKEIAKSALNYPRLTNCCGSPPKSNGDTDTDDFGYCPHCQDHCLYGYFDQDGNFYETEQEAINNDLKLKK